MRSAILGGNYAGGGSGSGGPSGIYIGGVSGGGGPSGSVNMGHTPKHYVVGGNTVTVCQDDQEYQQLGGLRRLDSSTSIRAHFYPEGGWGWIVCACAFLAHVTTSGAQLSSGALHIVLSNKFQDSNAHYWLGPLSWSVSSLCSPLIVNLCRRKNVRILSLVGGILFPLSLLFTSFATELHQIFFSFGLIGGIGSCMVRESSGIVLGEYFRRRRNFVEQVVLAGTGVGVTLFSLLFLSLSRHIEWGTGFRIGAALSIICALLPAFYRAASSYHPNRSVIEQYKHQRQLNKSSGSGGTRRSSLLLPLGGDIFHSLHLFCIPSLKPILWSAGIASFGLYAPVFLMSDFGRKEGLSGGSLLLLQTHLGLGLSLGVILGAILTLKKFRCCNITPRMLCCATCVLTGLSMIAISSVKGYYGYSLSAWIYGIALGSYLYTLKILTMDLTRTKYWSRIWSCVQSLMAPGILLGSGATSFLGKPGFYACATCVLLGAGLIGFQLIDLSKCGSPPLSSLESNESPIPPLPPPILHHQSKYPGASGSLSGSVPGSGLLPLTPSSRRRITDSPGGFFPLRKSISQPFYPMYWAGEDSVLPPSSTTSVPFSIHCPDCNPSLAPYPPPFTTTSAAFPGYLPRSFSLPQELPELKTTSTQTNPNSPERQRNQDQQEHLAHSQGGGNGMMMIFPPGTFDHLSTAVHARRLRDSRRAEEEADEASQNHPSTTTSSRHHSRTASTGSTSGLPHQNPPPASSSQVYPAENPLRLPPAYKHSVMFASNPQLYPQSSFSSQTDSSRPPSAANYYTQAPSAYHQFHHHHHPAHHLQHARFHQQASVRSSKTALKSNNRQPDPPETLNSNQTIPNETGDQNRSNHRHQSQQPAHYGRSHGSYELQPHHQQHQVTLHQQEQSEKPKTPKPQKSVQLLVDDNPKPAFTRHYFDSSKILQNKKSSHVQFKKPDGQHQSQPQSQLTQQPHQQPTQFHPYPPQSYIQSSSTTPSQYQLASGHSSSTQYHQSQQYQQSSGGQQQSKPGKYPLQKQPNVPEITQQPKQESLDSTTLSLIHEPPSVHYFTSMSHVSKSRNFINPPGIINQPANEKSNTRERDPLSKPPFSQYAFTPAYHQQQPLKSQAQLSRTDQHHHHPQSHHHPPHPPHPQRQQQRQSKPIPTTPYSHQGKSYPSNPQPLPPGAYPPYYYYNNNFQPKQYKISSSEFDVEEPKFNSLRRPTSANSYSNPPSYYDPMTGGFSPPPPLPSSGGATTSGGAHHHHPDPCASCPYCDPDKSCPPLSLSVPAMQPGNPHLMCHYGVSPNHPMLRRRNTWHYHKDFLEAITTSV